MHPQAPAQVHHGPLQRKLDGRGMMLKASTPALDPNGVDLLRRIERDQDGYIVLGEEELAD